MSTSVKKEPREKSNPDVEKALREAEEPGPHIPLDDIIEQSSRPEADSIVRQMLRGDETAGDPDDRDLAGAVGYDDTPHGRENRKNDVERGLD